MFRRNYLLNLCGVILVAISFGVLLSSDEANAQNAIATLANGNYQLCSQPKPLDWRNGAGVCFNFTKNFFDWPIIGGGTIFPRSPRTTGNEKKF